MKGIGGEHWTLGKEFLFVFIAFSYKIAVMQWWTRGIFAIDEFRKGLRPLSRFAPLAPKESFWDGMSLHASPFFFCELLKPHV
jgi:hypothetical protein